ncbi:PRC-barrel domain-containing protein [Pedobacter aquatilis]|uniref:PRC-barrel domain-containing protein n=1 Tax=Pedobacter aquatilis TaxID=351343 RepID=UPI00292FA471|nr:PRC-barrel domain-containing protein [Pedobacter aquatilis]
MNTTPIQYSNLEEFSSSGYVLTNGGTDVSDWSVQNESDQKIGRVRDLLFDPLNNTIRYLIIELLPGLNADEKAIIIPIGLVNIASDEDLIVLPDLHQEQLSLMPRYISGEVTHEMEDRIRSIIGSPAALRLEEDIIELDRENFYKHHHFDKGNIGRNIQSSSNTSPRLPIDPSEVP